MPKKPQQATVESNGELLMKLLPTEIVADEDWNSRVRPERGESELSDEELASSIRESGLLQPLRVRKLNGAWTLVFGFRRLRACLQVAPGKKVPCTVMPTTGNFVEDDLRARLENLAENGPRLALKPYELADSVYRLRQLHPDMTFKQIGERVGKSDIYVERLCRIRAKLCAELLEAWCANPDRFRIEDLLSVVPELQNEQVAAYNRRLADRRGGRPKGSKTARPVNMRDIEAWKEDVDEARRLAKHPRDISVLVGVKRTLEAIENGALDIKELLK